MTASLTDAGQDGGSEAAQVVAVIIPMYNSAGTIAETLASVRNQTYSNLDIVVVDDGSRDYSAAIVKRQMTLDDRIRLVSQSNQGVAAARNTGVAATTAPYLSFVDADDLWAPDKIADQLAILDKPGAPPALAYCWHAQIDVSGRVLWTGEDRPIEGHVMQELCRSNFVGNGSSMMMPREIFDTVGGFDVGLRKQHAQGCEDLMFLLRAAERFEFRCVPRRLVGYRQTSGNMSGDVMQMVRSCELVLSDIRTRNPQYAPETELMLKDLMSWLCYRAMIGGRVVDGLKLLARLHKLDSKMVHLEFFSNLARSYVRGRLLPDWLRARVQPLVARTSRARPAYLEMSW